MGRQTRLGSLVVFLVALSISPARSQTPDDAPDYPGARGYAQLVPHPPTGTIILFGGESNSRFSYEATWSYDPASNHWERIEADVHPANVGGTAAAYDAESDRIIFLFTTRLDSSAPRGLVRLTETWALDVATGTWTNMDPSHAPFGTMGARMAYDADSDRIVLFGGADFTREKAEWFDGTWAYDFNSNSWTEMQPETVPPGRSYFAMTYDSKADRILAFSGSPSDDTDSMWSYDYDSDSWEEIEYSGTVQADHHSFMIYAPSIDRTLHMVGESFSSFDYSTDTWEQLSYDSGLGTRHFLAMAYHEETEKIVVFGGGPRGLRYDNETWIYEPATDEWSKVGPAGE